MPVLQTISDGEIEYTPGPPEFSSLTAETLGNAGTNQDGFDSMLNEVFDALASDSPSLASLDSLLGDAAFTPGEIEGHLVTPVVSDIASFQQAGDALVTNLDATLSTGPAATTGGGAPAGGCPAAPAGHEAHIVTVSPFEIQLAPGQTVQFAAFVDGVQSTAVAWGANLGPITAGRVYTPPAAGQTDRIMAVFTDGFSTGYAWVGVAPQPPPPIAPLEPCTAPTPTAPGQVTIAICPTGLTLPFGQAHPFSFDVAGTSDRRVTWKACAGIITAEGEYHAPTAELTDQITVTSVADPRISASAGVGVVPPVAFGGGGPIKNPPAQ